MRPLLLIACLCLLLSTLLIDWTVGQTDATRQKEYQGMKKDSKQRLNRLVQSKRLVSASEVFLSILDKTTAGGVRRHKRQSQSGRPPIANGEVLMSVFQIPIQTLNAVHNLLQATRGRLSALQDRYMIQQAQHPNHRPNPHFVWDRKKERGQETYNSKDIPQLRDNLTY